MDSQTIVSVCTVAALIAGPISAVGVTIWSQKRSAKRAAKERVFLELMAHRKVLPPPLGWADSLNLIDVIYDDEPTVLACWAACYDHLMMPGLTFPNKQWDHLYLDLLSAMATCLRYKNLKQTTIDKFYIPQVHGTARETQGALQQEFLRVLKATKNLDALVEAAVAPPAPGNAMDPRRK